MNVLSNERIKPRRKEYCSKKFNVNPYSLVSGPDKDRSEGLSIREAKNIAEKKKGSLNIEKSILTPLSCS